MYMYTRGFICTYTYIIPCAVPSFPRGDNQDHYRCDVCNEQFWDSFLMTNFKVCVPAACIRHYLYVSVGMPTDFVASDLHYIHIYRQYCRGYI